MTGWQVIAGDCVEQMAAMPEASVDAVVCDPPYGLEFMGKEWDRLGASAAHRVDRADEMGEENKRRYIASGVTYGQSTKAMQAWHEAWAREALRVLKPGGHLLAFGGTRTYHRLACAIEDAGFEIRDTIAWMYGSGFPKSLDVSKAIDAAAGAERAVVAEVYRGERAGTRAGIMGEAVPRTDRVTAPATPDAERWQGWGTALKPAHEPIVVARKPLAGTVAGNVLAHGTGALNVDGCRIGMSDEDRAVVDARSGADDGQRGGIYHDGVGKRAEGERFTSAPAGRWPANVVLDPEAARRLDPEGEWSRFFYVCGESSGTDASTSDGANPEAARSDSSLPTDGSGSRPTAPPRLDTTSTIGTTTGSTTTSTGLDSARALYVPKASSAERNAGLDGFEAHHGPNHLDGGDWSRNDTAKDGVAKWRPRQNVHPTVKPIDLMRWLVRLVTPPGGLVLDPFTGSGTTGCAAMLEGFRFVGIEREPEYAAIARARIAWWAVHPDGMELVDRLEAEKTRKAVADSGQLDLLEDVA